MTAKTVRLFLNSVQMQRKGMMYTVEIVYFPPQRGYILYIFTYLQYTVDILQALCHYKETVMNISRLITTKP
jgi:hypothetical protein